MDVGIVLTARNYPPRPRPIADIYAEVIEEAVLAEELGFSHVWLTEHHLSPDQWCPSPLVLLSAIAARTKSIRLGTYVMLLALQQNPLKLAEDIATLDNISGGRFDFGFSPGNFQKELDGFGVPRAEIFGRARETLEIIERAFNEQEFSYEGKYFKYDRVSDPPKPTQRPFPMYSGSYGPKNVVQAAQRGYHCLSGLVFDVTERHEAAWVEAGRDRNDLRVISGPHFIHMSDSVDQAWREAAPHLHAFFNVYPKEKMPWFPDRPEDVTRDFVGYGTPYAFGTPADALEVYRRYNGRRCDELALIFNMPGLSTASVRRSMERFAKEAMPEIKTWPTGSA
jgi:alkanesulfonate monooxygenase SsuD/methylene tetrahydromethanopterin reductase-like flavin-dependent oxidoreductase (luciferase family)